MRRKAKAKHRSVKLKGHCAGFKRFGDLFDQSKATGSLRQNQFGETYETSTMSDYFTVTTT
jgi:hypothetical protein